MGRTTNGLIKSRIATATVRAYRFVVEGATDGTCVEATGATTTLIGISAEVDTPVGDRVSVQQGGNVAEILYGGTIARGDYLTSDAQGRAIATTTTGNRYGGIAEVSGVVGDIGTATVALGIL